MFFVFACLLALALTQEDKILLPLAGAQLTIGTDGLFSSPTLVRWVSDKPATAKVEITLRVFGSIISLGDRNKLVRASPRFNDTNVIKNVLVQGQTYSEVDISKFALTDFAGAPLKNADPLVVQLLNGNASVLHVEVSCGVFESPTKCVFNDDLQVKTAVVFAGGPCWFANACDARGPPNAVVCEPSDADQMPVRCQCASGYKAADQSGKGKCVADGAASTQPVGSGPTVAVTTQPGGSPPTTTGGGANDSKMSSSSTIGKAAALAVVLAVLQF